jgi:citrate lyase beta subunit
MRHFQHLPDDVREQLFERPPEAFGRRSDVPTLAAALGATLYMPATRPALADDIVRQHANGVLSVVVCLEDGVADGELPAAEKNLVAHLQAVAAGHLTGGGRTPDGAAGDAGPLVFVRVRRPEQIASMVDRLGAAVRVVSGFVLPKFTERSGSAFLEAVVAAGERSGQRLLAMPVLESPEIVHVQTRQDALAGVQRVLDKYREQVLAIRVGATDMCSAYGIRRDRDLTIYDVGLVADAIGSIVNMFGRADGTGYVVTGPVWEYFHHGPRLFKPQLRQTPFDAQHAHSLRQQLLTRDIDGLIREVVLDKANGLTGKTVIHPSHVAAVHALCVVSHEEYVDALDVLGSQDGGVAASSYGNKMNEAKPHRTWAERTMRRAAAFGVAAHDVSFVDLIAAQARR